MFVLLPWKLETSQRDERSFAIANGLLIAINMVVYLWGGFWPVSAHGPWINVLLYGFSHAGLWHLAANLWTLWLFGNPINRRLGDKLYLAVYLGTVVTLGVLARWCIATPLVGSSGALFAVIALAVFLEPRAVLHVVGVAAFPLTAIIGIFAPPRHWTQWCFRYETLQMPLVSCLILVPLLLFWEFCWQGWNWATTAHLLGVVCGVIAVLLLPKRITLGQQMPSHFDYVTST